MLTEGSIAGLLHSNGSLGVNAEASQGLVYDQNGVGEDQRVSSHAWSNG